MTKRKWSILSMLFLLIITVNTVSFVYAYFYKEANVPNTELNFGQVDVSSLIYFENGTELIDPINVPTRDNQSKQGIYYVNISDLDNPYYINKLRVDFNIESTVETYFRVKIVDTLTIVYEKANGDIVEISVPSETTENINYTIDSNNWYYDQKSDWYYYKHPVTRLNKLINLIENAYSIVNKSTIDVNLRIIIKYYLGDSLQELSIDDLVQVYDFNNNLIWQLEEDGFYHYRENDGVITTVTTIPLFSNLTLDGYKFGNEYQNQKIKIKLIVQAKQAKHVTWQDLGEKLLNP